MNSSQENPRSANSLLWSMILASAATLFVISGMITAAIELFAPGPADFQVSAALMGIGTTLAFYVFAKDLGKFDFFFFFMTIYCGLVVAGVI